MKRINKKYIFLLVAILLAFGLAKWFEGLHNRPVGNRIDIEDFQQKLDVKYREAELHLDSLRKRIETGKLPFLQGADKDISYYIYNKGSLVYWTDNELGMPLQYNLLRNKVPFAQLQNAYCVLVERDYKAYRLLAAIKVKNNYASPNAYLVNDFMPDFEMSPLVRIVSGKEANTHAVFTPSHKYLFTLVQSKEVAAESLFATLSAFCWLIGFVLLLVGLHGIYWFFGRKRQTAGFFAISFLLSGGIICLCFLLNVPKTVFSTELFSPLQYASGGLLSSLGQLVVVSLFVLGEVIYFITSVKKSQLPFFRRYFWVTLVVFQLFFVGFFSGICWLFRSLIYDSSSEVTLTDLGNISAYSVVFLLLILTWFVSFVLLRNRHLNFLKKKYRVSIILISNGISALLLLTICLLLGFSMIIPVWYFIFCIITDYSLLWRKPAFSVSHVVVMVFWCSLFVVWFSIKHTYIKQKNQNEILAQNLHASDLSMRNMLAEIMFEDLSDNLYDDETLLEMIRDRNVALIEIQKYLHQKYFRGFWDNYDMKMFLFDGNNFSTEDAEENAYYLGLKNRGEHIKKSLFYFCGDSHAKVDYLGVFPFKNTNLYISLHSKLLAASYGYPQPLLETEGKRNLHSEVSIANYENDSLISKTGDHLYPASTKWIKGMENNSSVKINNHVHFVYKTNKNNTIVISQPQKISLYAHVTYCIYLFLLYMIVLGLGYALFFFFSKKKISSFSFFSKLQLSYLSLLVVSFLAIFYVSTNYIINQYQNKQNADLENKTQFIRKYIEESFKKHNNLKEVNVVDLGFYLQELSQIYKTDIHVYDKNGYLVASSQPIIFSKGLMGYCMSPVPFYNKKENNIQTESIGKLNYLAAYTGFYNSKGKLLGYIAVPSFLSADAMRKEIFSLLSTIINIYLIIIALAFILSLVINRQLTKPIKALENKLRTISLKEHNQKLDYNHKDEIGELVSQYNKMVDKLEESAAMLAKSERESAWKLMARQVTHEINNPLTPMKLTIQQLQRMQAEGNDDFEKYFKKSSKMLIEQIEHLSNIATAFSDFAKMPEAKHECIDLPDRLETIVDLFRNNNEEIDIEYTKPSERICVLADKEQLTQVFNNLIKNAIQAIPPERKGKVTVNISKENHKVVVEVKDNGTGIPPEAQDKLFVPNFTTKTSGMGLGLAIVKNIVIGNGGSIWFESTENEGTSFFVKLPLDE